MLPQSITPRPYTGADQPAVLALLGQTPFVHRNLNWQTPEEWLASDNLIACVGLHRATIAAFLALSRPIAGVSWLRIIALGQGISRGPALRRLWHCLEPQLARYKVEQVQVLLTSDQFRPVWQSLGFKPVEAVVLLRLQAERWPLTPPSASHGIKIRPAQSTDLDHILALDHATFTPPWRLHPQELQAGCATQSVMLAFQEKLTSTDALVGYAIAQGGDKKGHIARLATHPAKQGQGIGSRLLHKVLSEFTQQGLTTITVNTKASNTGSQHLYQRFGFTLTGDQWPVYAVAIANRSN